jgi:tryptophan synthase alpha chain
MTDRYATMFDALTKRKEGAFVPFSVAGDPDSSTSLDILLTLAQSGADALEVGLPFSDPVADGPTIQKADMRALSSKVRIRDAWKILGAVRERFPYLPIGLLVYANLVEVSGHDAFYKKAFEVGIDSVLVADVPTVEATPYADCAKRHGIDPVLIATPNCSERHLKEIARLSRGYTYVVTRTGVTGTDRAVHTENHQLISNLRSFGAPPCLIGFGISTPEHVRNVLKSGAAGAICGSALVQIVEKHANDVKALLPALKDFITEMKAATRLA